MKANLFNEKHLFGPAASTLALLKDPHLPSHSDTIFPGESFPVPTIYILVVRREPQSTTWSNSGFEY